MARTRKTRTLHLADGGRFIIGPGTVSVPVSAMDLDPLPPAVVLHINRSCGALELEPEPDGSTPPPIRVNPPRCVLAVGTINAHREAENKRGAQLPLVKLPQRFFGTAKHVHAWQQQFLPFAVSQDAAGYPGQLDGHRDETLWFSKDTNKTVLEFSKPPHENNRVHTVVWRELTPTAAVEC